ncbi:uncharacterized protein LOC108206085 isoform X2 [Daucus carota subsp. sativus]|uniref:uncharacterized protein LOC108206085 isoform X2 n=1 Tax=Daucus carota subsp. sativus TaxID=79200 RepID=UPI0007EF2A9B|nr:PREDICTED: uncharacterized protein LOC108206085 isoform X2 [Daucus carota subsp. sativus]
MATQRSLSPLHTPLFLSLSAPKSLLFSLPKLPFPSLKSSAHTLSLTRASPNAQNDAVLEILSSFDGSDNKALPAVRTYENELTRLSLVGAVDFDQAVVAAAADGGEAAEEHVVSGSNAMVVETVFPGGGDEKGTVSTRLFLPASKVKEKSKKLKRILIDDILSSTSSRNILAMTFRQVVVEQLWNWEMVIFRPGTQRNMDDLMKPREVPASFTLSSSDELSISVLAEVVCLAVLDSTERHFCDKSLGRGYASFFNLFRKTERISSKDRSVSIQVLVEDELVRNAKILLEKFNFEKTNNKLMGVNPNYNWWMLSAFSELTKIGGPEFSTWVSQYVPAYKLQIDHNKLKNIKFDGWKNTSDNWWEVLLTHSQMVGLANILDMYYEDLYTLPNKELSCGAINKATDLFNKGRISFLKILSTFVVVSVLSLVAISTTGKLRLPHIRNGRMYLRDPKLTKASDTEPIHQQSADSAKSEDLATSIVATVKETYGWPGDIMKQSDGAAWVGELPEFYKSMVKADYLGVDNTSVSASSERIDDEIKALTQDIGSYQIQIILSAEGKITGIQPTSSTAFDHWATNPLAKELYVGKNVLPGLPNPRLENIGPTEMVVLDLFIPVNTGNCFALARPTKL